MAALFFQAFAFERRKNDTGGQERPRISFLRVPFLCRLCVLGKEGGGRSPSQDLAGVVVHPFLCLGHLRRRHFVKVDAFGEEPPQDPVHVLIAAPLVWGVRVTVV